MLMLASEDKRRRGGGAGTLQPARRATRPAQRGLGQLLAQHAGHLQHGAGGGVAQPAPRLPRLVLTKLLQSQAPRTSRLYNPQYALLINTSVGERNM